MEEQGVRPEEIKFVEMPPPDMPGALAGKAIDAYFVGEPFAAKAELDGSGRVLYYAKDIWPHFISCVLVVHEKLIKERPEWSRIWFEALHRAANGLKLIVWMLPRWFIPTSGKTRS
jgi:ABC-type nitrate/sulfonate/bicarbonate transport system substrate-binding protein